MRLIFIIEPMLYSKKKDCIVQSFFYIISTRDRLRLCLYSRLLGNHSYF